MNPPATPIRAISDDGLVCATPIRLGIGRGRHAPITPETTRQLLSLFS